MPHSLTTVDSLFEVNSSDIMCKLAKILESKYRNYDKSYLRFEVFMVNLDCGQLGYNAT
jgi:hypothetical protein